MEEFIIQINEKCLSVYADWDIENNIFIESVHIIENLKCQEYKPTSLELDIIFDNISEELKIKEIELDNYDID